MEASDSKAEKNNETDIRKNKMISSIVKNYQQIEKSIVDQLYMKHDLHGVTVGSERERIWAQLFERIIPKKFTIEQSVFIIDSKGSVSHEVDFAIMDVNYTPYIFRYGEIKFVPIEAVAVVVECKSQNLTGKTIDVIKDWAESIDKLETSAKSVTRLATGIITNPPKTQQSTRPIRILCALKENCSPDIEKYFDFTLLASGKEDGYGIKIETTSHLLRLSEDNKENTSLLDWHNSLNFHNKEKVQEETLANKKLDEYQVRDTEGKVISILTFNFQLNQLLMLINNPMMFPHQAYVQLFNSYIPN